MAEQRSLAKSMTTAGVLASATREAEPLVKGESVFAREQEAERAFSEPSSLKIPPPSFRSDGRGKGKSTFQGPPKDVSSYQAFRRLCDNILEELARIDAFVVQNELCDEGSEVVAEVEALLEVLYACPYGQGESLKRVVVAIQSQVNNARWDRRHVSFLRDVFRFLRVRYLVDEATVKTCYDFMKERGLDPFRGTICEPQVVKRYRIQEVVEDDESHAGAS